MALRFEPSGTITAARGRRLRDETLADLARTVAAMGEVARAEFRYGMAYETANGRITDVDLTVRLSLEMPVWTRYPRRPKAEKDEWDRFYRALRYHEDGHISLYRREFTTAYRRLEASTPATIDAVLDQEVRRIRRLDADYDSDTDHGRSQDTPHGTTVIQVP